jgi:transcriptional regulator with XRE-family HTH domain
MSAGVLLVEARRRAGLSQAEVARRISRKQSTVARWERGFMEPGFDAVIEALRACGFEPDLSLSRYDDSYVTLIEQQLSRAPSERLDALTVGGFDPKWILRVLREDDVRFLLVGSVAGALRGSPLMVTDELVLVPEPRPRNLTRLRKVLGGLAERPDADLWVLRDGPGSVRVLARPPGTRGYADLARDAESVNVDVGLAVMVASPIDLLRIAEAHTNARERAAAPALRTLLDWPKRKGKAPLPAWTLQAT